MSFTAEFPGECAECGLQMLGTEAMFRIDAGLTEEIVHVRCPRLFETEPCPRCFLVLPLTGVCAECE